MLTTIIGTRPDRAAWLQDSLASVPGDALVVSVPGYEIGKLEYVFCNTNLDRFLFIQDSVTVTPALYAILSKYDASVALLSDPKPFGCYLGVYERRVLSLVGFPKVRSKLEAVQAEATWTERYCQAAGDVPILFPELTDQNAGGPIMRHGRENLVLSNMYITKYKGTWRQDQIAT